MALGRGGAAGLDRLPYVDDYVRHIEAPPKRVWDAVAATCRTVSPQLPDWLASAWGLQHRRRFGSWDRSVAVGDTLTGFVASEVEPLQLLALSGRHRFSDYELRFELKQDPAGGTRVRATTLAAFPGLKGQRYRIAVIGTRGHRIAMGRLLAAIARRAVAGD